MEDRTEDQLAQDYSALGDSVAVITDVIAGDSMADDIAADRQSAVDRNVEHLVLKKAEKTAEDDSASIWTDESFTAIDAAISAGNGYTAS